MRKLISTALLLFLGLLLANAQNFIYLDGQVTDIENGNPVPGHEVFVSLDDSLSFYMYITDINGMYGDTIDISGTSVTSVYINTFDCNFMMLDTMITNLNDPIVADFQICTDSLSPGGDCFADFYYYPDSSNAFTFSFIDMSFSPTGNIVSWSWDFGDGSYSTDQNPIHTYSLGGEYLVCLTIEDDQACLSTHCVPVFVFSMNDCVSQYYYYPGWDNPLEFEFFDASMGYPTSWLWDFGDGTTSTEQNPVHTFTEQGIYLVCLTIEGDSCSDTYCEEVYVENPVWDCYASYYYYPDSVDLLTQYFIDMSGTPTGIPDSWYWDFGDGTSSTEQNPVHTYAEGGIYLVCLTIESDSCSDTYCEEVFILNPSECMSQYFYYPDDSLGFGSLSYQFIDVSFGSPDSWLWDFGDGNTSTEQNPLHTFDDYGTYYVCLTISNDSCTDTYCDSVFVYDWPMDCSNWFDYVATDLTVDFSGYVINQLPADYDWDFGDGTTGTGQYVTHTYPDNGFYLVTLTTEDAEGCIWTTTQEVWVGDMEFNISGTVFVDSTYADYANVYLMTFDTLWTSLITVDVTSLGADGTYLFEDVNFDTNWIYFVQAELTDQSVYYGDYLPTYHLSTINWEEAWPVFPCPIMPYPADIFMVPSGSYSTGNGVINGTVHAGDSRGVLENVEMILLNNEHDPLTYMRSDGDGSFDFSHLAYGTYIVYTEIVGVETTPAVITLSEENPREEISIVVKNGQALLDISEINSEFIEEVGMIYPNPVVDHAQIDVSVSKGSDVSITIVNQLGQTVYSATIGKSAGIHKIEMETAMLDKGLYTLQLITQDGAKVVRKFVKLH